MHRRVITLALAALATGAVAGCTEKLESGEACPVLCPGQEVPVRDTTIYPVAIDTTLAGFPELGEENSLLLAAIGDSIDTRAVVRFEVLDTFYISRNAATPNRIVERVDSARIELHVIRNVRPVTDSVTIEAYDVDTSGVADTAVAPVAALFRPDRLLGTLRVGPASFTDTARIRIDTLRVPLANDVVLAKIKAGERVRVGLRVTAAAEPIAVQLHDASSGAGPRLVYRASNDVAGVDTSANAVVRPPSSTTPDDALVRARLTDYTLLVKGTPLPGPQLLGVGGAPGRRIYLRFDLPRGLLDSTTIVRATLQLTQQRSAPAGTVDTLTVLPQLVIAGRAVTDLRRAVQIMATAGGLIDPLRLAPGDSGLRQLEVARVVRFWITTASDSIPRAIALFSPDEGTTPSEIRFFSTEAADSLRPRLRINYIPRVDFGLP